MTLVTFPSHGLGHRSESLLLPQHMHTRNDALTVPWFPCVPQDRHLPKWA